MFPNSPYAHAVGSFRTPIEPPATNPTDSPTTTISVNCGWLPYIRGALYQLLLQSTWDTDAAGLENVQYQVGTLLNLFGDEACEMCDCLEFTGNGWKRFVPDGHGGGSFVPVDPRKDGDVPPPWPTPPMGQTGQCLSAANIVKLFQTMMEDTAAKLAILAEVGAMLIAFEQYLALALGPIGEVVAIATDMAVAVIGAGSAVTSSAFDPATQTAAYDGIRCIMQCHMAADGSIGEAGIAAIKSDFFDKIDSWVANPAENALWRILFPDFLDSQGKNGLTLMGTMANITSADCSACDCGWVCTCDFTLSDYGFSPAYAGGQSYVAGLGWESNGVTALIARAYTVPLLVDGVEFVYAWNGSGSGPTSASAIWRDDTLSTLGNFCSGITTPAGNCTDTGDYTGSGLSFGVNTSHSISPDGLVITRVQIQGHGTPPDFGVIT